jgi:AraC-like DNA-binding protein
VKTADGEFIVDEGKGFFLQMPANECYFFDEAKNSAPWEFIYILFDPTLVEDYCRYIENRFGKIISLPVYSRAVQQLLSIYDSAEKHMQNPFLMSSMVFEFLCLLCNETGQSSNKKGDLADKAKKIMDEKCNSQISIYDVSLMLNVSQSHLSREFFKSFGVKPIEYLTKQRIKNAVSLISTSELNFEAVSKSCGFSNSGYFSKVFKKYMRMSPAQFKKYVRAEGYSKIKI